MNRGSKALAVFVTSLILALGGCFQATEPEAPFVDPCVPLAGSEVDPCERQPLWNVPKVGSGAYRAENMPTIPYSVLDEIRRLSDLSQSSGVFAPQFYVRGTFIPGSSRCVRALAFVGVSNDGSLTVIDRTTEPQSHVRHDCFIDVRVHEYLNGDGPERVPIAIWHFYTHRDLVWDDYDVGIEKEAPMSWLEGREMVLALSRPNNISLGAWGFVGFQNLWDLQRRDDGEVVVVGGWAHLDSRPNATYEFPLEQFRVDIKNAMDAIQEENNGRAGSDPGDKALARDANLRSLLDHLSLHGAYSVPDITPVAAPLVPGETDPDPYGLLVSEDAAPTSSLLTR